MHGALNVAGAMRTSEHVVNQSGRTSLGEAVPEELHDPGSEVNKGTDFEPVRSVRDSGSRQQGHTCQGEIQELRMSGELVGRGDEDGRTAATGSRIA